MQRPSPTSDGAVRAVALQRRARVLNGDAPAFKLRPRVAGRRRGLAVGASAGGGYCSSTCEECLEFGFVALIFIR